MSAQEKLIDAINDVNLSQWDEVQAYMERQIADAILSSDWLAAHDAEKRAEWEAEQGETEYIVRDHYGGLWTLTSSLDEARHYVLREPGTVMEQRKVTPWLPVPDTVRESDSGVRDSDNEESEGE